MTYLQSQMYGILQHGCFNIRQLAMVDPTANSGEQCFISNVTCFFYSLAQLNSAKVLQKALAVNFSMTTMLHTISVHLPMILLH